MWNWFGGGNTKARKDAPKNAILELRSQLEMLQKRQRHLQNQMDEQDGAARKYVSASNTTAAKAALRRKKTHEHARDQTLAQIDTLDQQINAIESANINFSTLAAMEQASKAMQQIHGKLTPEKVDETMDKLRDQNALSEEIVNAITQNPLGQTDDAELEDELEELQQEFAEEQMLKTDGVPITDAVHKMPTPSTAEPVSSRRQPVAVEEDDEDAEIRRLQAEMAM